MSILISVFTVLFVILCVLLVILILLQSDKSAGMGILGGSSQSAFGSSTADVITKISAVMIGLYMLGSLGLSVMESYKVATIENKVMMDDNVPSGMIDTDVKGKDAPGGKGIQLPADKGDTKSEPKGKK